MEQQPRRSNCVRRRPTSAPAAPFAACAGGLFRNAVLLTGAVFRHRIAGGGSRMFSAAAVICRGRVLVFIDLRTLT